MYLKLGCQQENAGQLGKTSRKKYSSRSGRCRWGPSRGIQFQRRSICAWRSTPLPNTVAVLRLREWILFFHFVIGGLHSVTFVEFPLFAAFSGFGRICASLFRSRCCQISALMIFFGFSWST
ncbi:hypothetical protein CEXT_370981 [Caerostris extrusa]|uniref:Uncharacterized protein n=1 Tax=Caerostris extrusa TaxID=172846 RepID=A0AAV4RMU3_CAEEX|nr:hypothetical protein CEXT_370981 [Caerostris extrusa]